MMDALVPLAYLLGLTPCEFPTGRASAKNHPAPGVALAVLLTASPRAVCAHGPTEAQQTHNEVVGGGGNAVPVSCFL
jgi:hypothetical protein